MGYGKRIDTLCSFLKRVETFADVGCDHGYCSEYMLKNGLCDKAILSDVSRGSLQKAQTLLKDYIDDGRAVAVLGDGFYGVPKDTELVLIAGMGGAEITSILSDETYGFIPKNFVLQPMHDSERLRRYLIKNGAFIERDFTFFDGKYYDLIVGTSEALHGETREYSELAYEFGKENLEKRPKAFLDKIKKLLKNVEKYLTIENLQEESKRELLERKAKLEGVLRGEG